MSSLAVSRFMLVSGSRALLTSSISRAAGFATVATSFSSPSDNSSPASRDTSTPSASFPSPRFMPPPPPPLPTTPSSPPDVAARPSSSNRIGSPRLEISYETIMEGSRAEKGLEHFVAMAAKEGEEKGGKGEKKPCTKACANCKKLEAVA